MMKLSSENKWSCLGKMLFLMGMKIKSILGIRIGVLKEIFLSFQYKFYLFLYNAVKPFFGRILNN